MDIVERLRSIDISWSEHGEWCAEAADEIERLREVRDMLQAINEAKDAAKMMDTVERLRKWHKEIAILRAEKHLAALKEGE